MSSQQENNLQYVNEDNISKEVNVVEKKDNLTFKKSSTCEDNNKSVELKNYDEIEDEDEDEIEDEINLDSFVFTENSDLYTICVDGIPICYVKDEKTACKKMWELARIKTFDSNCSGWRTNLIEVRQNELHLLGSYKFFIVSYDKLLKRISYNRVQECVDTCK